MKKAFLMSFGLITLLALNANAQQKYSLSFGGGYSNYKATGNPKSSSGFGLDVTAKAALSQNV